MRCKLSFTYDGLLIGGNQPGQGSGRAQEAESDSTNEYLHWADARNYAHHNDYQRAGAEAKATVAMAPYDTLSHSGLSWIMSEAGDHESCYRVGHIRCDP